MKTVLAALACIVAASWIYLLVGAGMPKMDMGGGKVMLMPPPSWTVGYAAIIFAMWTIMMVAMMIPSAATTIVRVANRAHGLSISAFFTVGYLIVWTGFSAVATIAQWAFDSAHVLSDSMALRSGVAAGLIVIAAGLYQLLSRETKLPAPLLLIEKFIRRRSNNQPSVGRAAVPAIDSRTGGGHGGPPHNQVNRNATRNPLRPLMPRLLLGDDVPAVRGRRDEHGLDSGDLQSGSWPKRHSRGACASHASPPSD